MKRDFLKVALRNNAIFIDKYNSDEKAKNITKITLDTIGQLAKNGFTVSEDLLWAINYTSSEDLTLIKNHISDVLGVKNNWTPLVKNWDNPTNETWLDHVITQYANFFGSKKGTRMTCGHIIHNNTFPIERYNGCPYCGTPFNFEEIEHIGQGSKLKVLELWTNDDVHKYFKGLVTSSTALDATQIDSLKLLIPHLKIQSNWDIKMKETLMVIIDDFIKRNESDRASDYFKSPTDILRYLWYKHTGFLQIVEPKIIVQRNEKNHRHFRGPNLDKKAKILTKEALKLKYNRKQCAMVAKWMNDLDNSPESICENMHSKRQMWIRFIRALRFTEYAKKNGYEKLREILDHFYNQTYEVTLGELNDARMSFDSSRAFAILKKRPGLFARSLFSNMLWFGAEDTIAAFKQVSEQVPMRLLLTLNMYADVYFDKKGYRSVKPIIGNNKSIPTNRILYNYSDEYIGSMKSQVEDLCIWALEKRFKKQESDANKIFIDPQLYNIPLSIGDRTENIQDFDASLMGTKFKIEEKDVRLFMQWGKGLPAQHLDMDLSCYIAFDEKVEVCNYSRLTATGAKHSGDIIHIPNKIGTAEYINLDIKKLKAANARYVMFTCNAYSRGSINPNLVVGWMNSANRMVISERSGVAYDPSCVIHQVRITRPLTKGIVFGVLDICNNEIIWLEMPFYGQTVHNMNANTINNLLNKLNAKTTIGRLLELRANAQNTEIVNKEEAEMIYDMNWSKDINNLNRIFVD